MNLGKWLTLALVVATAPVWAQNKYPQRLGETPSGLLHVLEVTNHGDVARVWFLTELNDKVAAAMDSRSAKTLYEVNCKEAAARFSVWWFAQPKAQGEVVSKNRDQEWAPIAPGSLARTAQQLGCK